MEPASSSTAVSDHFRKALRHAKAETLKSGLAGMAAMAVQVLTLMWMRTAFNYQCRHGGTSMVQSIKALYAEGGFRRLYRGVGFALLEAPLVRFGDTGANAGVLCLLSECDATRDWPTMLKTFVASLVAATFRCVLIPLDCAKTHMQVDGAKGLDHLRQKIAQSGPQVLYRGALAAWATSLVRHFPFFTTFNWLDHRLPHPESLAQKLLRSAFMGWCASVVSDCVSNPVRVLKTVKQTKGKDVTYRQVIRDIVQKDGPQGLFLRGLTTKLATNGVQGVMFTVLWRLGQDALEHHHVGE
jgi:hypothetical protein